MRTEETHETDVQGKTSMALVEIRSRIQKAKTKSDDSMCQAFMPNGAFSGLLSYENVLEALQSPKFKLGIHKRENTAQLVIDEPAMKIFAILVEIQCEEYLGPFLEGDYSDKSLPLDQSILGKILLDNAELFGRLQHDYLAYSFRKGQFHRTIRNSQILPYTQQEHIGGGGYSLVYRAYVHPLHQNFVETLSAEAIPVIRKQLNTSQENAKAEAELLYLLGSLRHRNIVEILTSYIHCAVANLLFRPADMDLHQLLLDQRPTPLTSTHDFLHAMHGLSSGLAYLHNYKFNLTQFGSDPLIMIGYHHDIKPRNILIRGSDFILADFGLARLKDSKDDSKTPWKETTFEYGPPECRDPDSFEPNLVGRALDIWSIGCIFAEVIAYATGGSSNVEAFRERRVQETKYGKTRCFHDGEKLSSSVAEFLGDINVKSSSRAFHNLSNLARRAFSTYPNDRPKAEVIELSIHCHVMEDLVDSLLDLISVNNVDNDLSRNSVLFRMHLSIEESRLLAWADKLGFISIRELEISYDPQVGGLASHFAEILKAALESWSSSDRFPDSQGNESYKLQSLRAANDDLREHLSAETKESIDESFHIIALERLSTLKEPVLAELNAARVQDGDFDATAAMKYMSILLERQKLKPSQPFEIESSLMRKPTQYETKTLGPYTWFHSYGYLRGEERKVFVEFVPYWWQELKKPGTDDFETAVELMFERIGQLVELLKQAPKIAGFLSLECIGAFRDMQQPQWGIVYAFPDPKSSPICLNDLLRQGKSAKMIPDLDQRFSLAKKLIVCIQSCHTAGWIHKNISSLSVQFFHSSPDLNLVQVNEPYLVGFDHSRPGKENAFTRGNSTSREQEYLHPKYRGGSIRARMSHDYYSLGLVLLEIGTWTSISNVHKARENLTLSPMKLRDKYIALCKQQLKKSMGETYQDITKTCLEFESESDDLNDRLRFQAEVVDKMKASRMVMF